MPSVEDTDALQSLMVESLRNFYSLMKTNQEQFAPSPYHKLDFKENGSFLQRKFDSGWRNTYGTVQSRISSFALSSHLFLTVRRERAER